MAIAERELSFSSESVKSYHWTREQFYQMGEAGLFQGQQVELIEGEILLMPAMGPLHRGMVTIIGDLLRTLFGDGYFVSSQGPFEAGRQSDPEPDIAIIRGNPRDYLLVHPSSSALIVEVSHTTLSHDRNLKSSLYAWSGVSDYWIVNLKSRQVEVHRQPIEEAGQPFGFGYAEIVTYRTGESIRLLEKPDISIPVVSLLP